MLSLLCQAPDGRTDGRTDGVQSVMGLARGRAADNVSCRCAGLTAVLILCIAVAVGLFIFIAGLCVIQRSETDAVLHCSIFDMQS